MVGSTKSESIKDTTTQWYCKHFDKHTGQDVVYHTYGLTTSWLRVSDFLTYWTNRIGSSNVKTYSSLTSLNSNCRIGDPVLLVNSAGTPYHAVIICSTSSNYIYTEYSGHTKDRDHASISNFSPEDNYKLLKMS